MSATYLSLRDIPLPDASFIDDTLRKTEPLQEASTKPVFSAIIKGYVYTLTPKATYLCFREKLAGMRGKSYLKPWAVD